ncbi:MAG: thiamine-phosphate pyrophosphorylase [Candidatus Omnitrophota bacterium]
MMTDRRLYRLLDANFNRAKEGLRVCEDVSRFAFNQRVVTRAFKEARHELTDLMKVLNWKEIIEARDIKKDIGKTSTASEMKRKNVEDILLANLQRVKESVRVLEEISKLMRKDAAERFKRLRYQIYYLEAILVRKFSFYK